MARSGLLSCAFSAGTTSTNLPVSDYKNGILSVAVPVLTSGDLSVEGSIDGTNWYALNGLSGSDTAQYKWTATTGSFISTIVVGGCTQVRFKNSVAQTATLYCNFV